MKCDVLDFILTKQGGKYESVIAIDNYVKKNAKSSEASNT
jgi:hypothetical protein